MGRRLSPDETAAWRRVQASVRALEKSQSRKIVRAGPDVPPAVEREAVCVVAGARSALPKHSTPTLPLKGRGIAGDTLDGGWDRKISRGVVAIDRTVDLHGHTLRSAHALLDAALDQAIARGDRVILLVTGKPPRAESERPHARGAIRAAVGDWLASSRHADRIASVRAAHPRHGGSGALYIVLRKPKRGG